MFQEYFGLNLIRHIGGSESTQIAVFLVANLRPLLALGYMDLCWKPSAGLNLDFFLFF